MLKAGQRTNIAATRPPNKGIVSIGFFLHVVLRFVSLRVSRRITPVVNSAKRSTTKKKISARNPKHLFETPQSA